MTPYITDFLVCSCSDSLLRHVDCLHVFACYTGVDFAFASYYSDHMVLQREPTRAAVWGYAYAVGDQVTVNIDLGDIIRSFTTTADQGSLELA